MLALVSGCATSSSYSLADSKNNPSYTQPPLTNLMVMALYPDEDIEVRVVVENAFSEQLRSEGTAVVPGFRSFASYDSLESRVDEISGTLEEIGIDGLILFDPVRAKAYDRSEYEDRRAVYRALGMESSNFFGAIGQLSAAADASKFIIEISLWNRESKDCAWWGSWNITAPDGYDLAYAKTYTAEFATIVAEQLRSRNLVN